MRLSELSDNLRSFLLGSDISDSDLLGEIISEETGYNDDWRPGDSGDSGIGGVVSLVTGISETQVCCDQ